MAEVRWRRLYGRTSAELREMYVEWYLLPAIRLGLAEDPARIGALVYVAQFYDDNANDEVHVRVLFWEPGDPPPDWPPTRPPDRTIARVLEQEGWMEPEEAATQRITPDDWVLERALREWHQDAWRPSDLARAHPGTRIGYLPPVPAFASWTLGGGNGETFEAFTPAAWIAPDQAGELVVTWLGKVLRPEVEDRFDTNSPVAWEPAPGAVGPLRAIPLPLLALIPEVPQRMAELASRARALTRAHAAGAPPGPTEWIDAFERWAKGGGKGRVEEVFSFTSEEVRPGAGEGLRLYGESPAELREMALDWILRPIALRTGVRVTLTLTGLEVGLTGGARVEEARRALFGGRWLDARDPSVIAAFSGFCGPGCVTFAVAEGDEVRQVATRRAPDPVWMGAVGLPIRGLDTTGQVLGRIGQIELGRRVTATARQLVAEWRTPGAAWSVRRLTELCEAIEAR